MKPMSKAAIKRMVDEEYESVASQPFCRNGSERKAKRTIRQRIEREQRRIANLGRGA